MKAPNLWDPARNQNWRLAEIKEVQLPQLMTDGRPQRTITSVPEHALYWIRVGKRPPQSCLLNLHTVELSSWSGDSQRLASPRGTTGSPYTHA